VASAVVLVKADMGSAVQVASALRKIPGVARAQAVTGPYDVIAMAEGKTVEELGEFVISKIQQTKGVKDTLTCLVVG
jgi:DNA-binding Lrp family transcriptional regulator